MSPFAFELRKIRAERKLQQKTMSEIIGCEQSYLCALETDAKVPPQGQKLLKLIKKLNLTEEEEDRIIIAAKQSKRLFKLPLKADKLLFEVCYELENQITTISHSQIIAIGVIVGMNAVEEEVLKM